MIMQSWLNDFKATNHWIWLGCLGCITLIGITLLLGFEPTVTTSNQNANVWQPTTNKPQPTAKPIQTSIKNAVPRYLSANRLAMISK